MKVGSSLVIADSIWFTTRSRLFHGDEETWEEVAAYTEPLGRLLARRYRWLSEQDREDLVQDILIEIRRTLVERHDRSRGRFRALLQTVVGRPVADVLRARRQQPLTELGLDRTDSALKETLKVFKASLRRPRDTASLRSSMPGPPEIRDELGRLLERFRAAIARLRGSDTASGDELRRGLDVILGDARGERAT